MKTVNEKYNELIERIELFSRKREDIRAVIVQGSRARTNMPADDWSDLDLSIITSTPDFYIANESWLSEIGAYWVSFTETNPGGIERRALFEDGLDVDFSIMPLEIVQQMMLHGIPEDAKYTLGRGVKILIDKEGIFDKLSEIDLNTGYPEPPSEQEYLNLVNDIIYHYIWTLKKIKRNEIWTAKGCSDNYLKWRLLSLAEWHARAVYGSSHDTWHAGRFIEKWADPRVVEGLKHSFARFDADEIKVTLGKTYKLFRMMALEVAEKYNYSYPLENEKKVLQWAEINLA